MELTDILLLCIAAIFLRLWWRYCFPSPTVAPKNLPPGPPGRSLVGNLLQHRPFINNLRKKYGPIFTLQMGQRPHVIITSSELIHEALVKKGPVFATRPDDSPIGLLFNAEKCTINSALYGPIWRSLRRNLITEIINPTRLKQFGWIRAWAIDNHMNHLREEASQAGHVEVMAACRLTVCSILICLCFGVKVSEESIKLIASVLKDIKLFFSPQLYDLLPILNLRAKKAKQLRKKQLDCFIPLINDRKALVESSISPSPAYVDSLFELELPGKGKLNEEEIVTLCSELINAGTETTSTTIEWAMLHLVQNQEIQEKLYDEIIGCVGLNGVINESDVEKMPYLGAIVKETFRRHPASHFLLPHAVTEETELGGYTIPANAIVDLYTTWLTEDPEVWENPSEFRPERFLTGDGVEMDFTGTRGVKMLPFGIGRRICPAWNLGVLHSSLLLARMVQEFKWVPIPGNPPNPTEMFKITVIMKDPLKAVILPRAGI